MMTLLRFVFALLMISSMVEAALPLEVAERFSAAQDSLEKDQFRGAYTVEISSVVAKPDGSAKNATDLEMSVEVDAEGQELRRLIRFIIDGEDQTEKHREDLESEQDEGNGDGEGDDDFVVPFGDDADHFSFAQARVVGGHIEMTFEPALGHEHDGNLTRGTLAWDEATLDPLWIEMDVLKPPKPLRELRVRMDFERVGDGVYMNRMVTDGRVKVLLMKRNFHMEMTVSDLIPAERPAR